MIAFDHPANRGVLGYLGDPERLSRSVSMARDRPECRPADVERVYESLGTHPDLVTRLWDEFGGCLPADCRAIAFGSPVLVHPDSGVIFGFGGGTHTYALRLSRAVRAAAIAAGASTVHHYPADRASRRPHVFDLAVFGEEWLFGGWFRDESAWCAAAYEFAAW